MFKFLLILAVGVLIGYFYGWNDAQVNDRSIAERMLDQLDHRTRAAMATNVDGRPGALDP